MPRNLVCTRNPSKRRWGKTSINLPFTQERVHTIYLGRWCVSWDTGKPALVPGFFVPEPDKTHEMRRKPDQATDNTTETGHGN